MRPVSTVVNKVGVDGEELWGASGITVQHLLVALWV